MDALLQPYDAARGTPVAAFRRVALDRIALALGILGVPASVINIAQAVDRDDPFIALAGLVYLVCGAGFFLLRRAHRRGRDVRVLFALNAAVLGLGTALFETPAGSSHLLGLIGLLFVLIGHVVGLRRRWRPHLLVGSALFFPAVLLVRQLYRPHPLLHDPLELLPQAAAGGLGVFALGLVLSGMVDAFAVLAAQARAAEVAKDRFLQNMSHELRTPLNAIIGYAELLEDELGANEDLGRICEAGAHLVTIIDDLLDLSRIDATGAHVDLELVDLLPVVERAVAHVRPQVERSRNRLVLPDRSARVVADRHALVRVLVNLLGNAAKFTSEGEIRVTIDEGPQGVTLAVADTGVGFDPREVERLFQPFQQADGSTTRRYGGTGLGLAISRRLAEAMGATLEAEGAPGAGATFTLRWSEQRRYLEEG